MADAEEVEYTKPTSQLDLEARLENDNKVAPLTKTVNPGYGENEAGNLYLGTNPEYQNHANDTEAPLQADEGADKLAEDAALKAYDSRDVKERAADPDNEWTGDEEGVSPTASVPEGLERGSVLVVEDPGTGEVPDTEVDDLGEGAGFTGGTGNAAPVNTTPAPSTPSPATPTPPSGE